MTPLHSIYLQISEPRPPSVNALYTVFHGRKVLTKTGRAFKDALTSLVVAECMKQRWVDAVDEIYLRAGRAVLVIGVHTSLWNASWKPGRKTKKGGRQSPYKKQDATSYIKVVEDAVADGTGIDDSANLYVGIGKLEGDSMIEVSYDILPAGSSSWHRS